MSKLTPKDFPLKVAENRHGGFEITARDSTLIGLGLVVAKNKEVAQQVADAINLVWAMSGSVKCSESESGNPAPGAVDAWIDKARRTIGE